MAEHARRANDDEIRDLVRERYANLAQQATGGASCCAPEERALFGVERYSEDDKAELPDAAALASLGCGNPTAVAALHPGEAVLDLGSGGGIDVLLSAKRVAPNGIAYGLDMTDEMLDLANKNAQAAGITNVRWLKGLLEDIPLPDESVDVVISNCVINLSPDKAKVLDEAARVLKSGGRFAVTDVIADREMTDETRKDMEQWAGCIAGALTRDEYEGLLDTAGLTDVQIQETHRVHPHAGSAIIRARKPSA
jgi:ubiquinone/menaquinone biosynthesis C-methylase UbiE